MARKWTAASFAIASMWIAVLFIAVFAPSLEATSSSGDTTSLPLAGIVAAAAAFIGTIVIASVGFGGRSNELDVERERLERERLELRIRELESRATPQDGEPMGKTHSLLRRS